MNTLIAIAALCLMPPDMPVEERVDAIELNHFYDERGKLVFEQAIFWAWRCRDCYDHEVVAWRLVKLPAHRPRYSCWRNEWDMIFHDGDTLRRVRTPFFYETWGQDDPELYQRELLPKERRRGLTKP